MSLLEALPAWSRLVIGFLIVDLGNWLSHLIRHKVPFLWKLHTVHHSQTEMNLITEFRSHPLDTLFASVARTPIFFSLLIPVPAIVLVVVLEKYYLMFLHANVDISYGPLDRVFVSPRVHRVHHSNLVEHYDHNFGAYLSIWDTLFGTLYRGTQRPKNTGL